VTSRRHDRPPAPKPADNARTPLQLYVQVIAAVGAAVIIESIFALRTTAHPFEWLLFVGLAVLTG
jgi:predicted cobalt transporter CbtA